MKTLSFGFLLALSTLMFDGNLLAQYSARQLTRKIVPPPANRPPAQPAPATARPAPVAPVAVTSVAPPRPLDPEKEKAKQAETLKKTIAFEKKRAAEGSPSAQYELGLRYLKGDGLDKDEVEARKLLEESAKNDYTLAKRKLEELDAKKK